MYLVRLDFLQTSHRRLVQKGKKKKKKTFKKDFFSIW